MCFVFLYIVRNEGFDTDIIDYARQMNIQEWIYIILENLFFG